MTTKPPVKRAKRRRLVLAVVAASLALLTTLPLAAWLWLGTQDGRDWLARTVEKLTADATVARLELRGLTGQVPFGFGLDELRVLDSEGPWLVARDLRVRISPKALLARRVHLREATARSVEVLRRPQTHTDTTPDAALADDEGFSLRPPQPPDFVAAVVADDLGVGRLRLAEPLLGREIVSSFASRAALRDGAAALNATLRQGGASEDRDAPDTLVLNLLLADGGLTLDARLFERGGLVGGLAGLPETALLDLGLVGRGPLEDWRGRLDARAEGLQSDASLSAEADLRLALEHMERQTWGLDLHAEGEARSRNLVPAGPARDLLGQTARFSLEAAAAEDRLSLRRAELAAGTVRLAAQGGLQTRSMRVNATARLELEDYQGLLARQTDDAVAVRGLSPLTLRASGPLASPALWLEAGAEAFDLGGLQARHLSLRAYSEALADRKLTVNATLGRLAPPAPGLPAGPARLAAELRLGRGPDEDVAEARSLLVEACGLYLEGAARATHESVPGNRTQALALGFTGRLRTLPRQDASTVLDLLDAVAGGPIRLGLNATREGALASLAALSLDAPHFGLEASGAYDLASDRHHALARLTVPEAGAFSELAGVPLAGTLRVGLNATGRGASLNATLRPQAEELLVAGQTLRDIDLVMRARDLPDAVKGDYDLSLVYRRGRLQSAAAYALDDRTLILEGLGLTTRGGGLRAEELALDLGAGLVEGDLRLDLTDLGVAEDFGGPALSGALRGGLRARPNDTEGDAGQDAYLELTATDLGYGGTQLDRAHLEADLRNLTGDLGAQARLRLDGLAQGVLQVETASVEANGGLGGFAFAANASGRAGAPLMLRATGDVSLDEATKTFTLGTLEARYDELPVRLRSPLRLTMAGETYTVDATALDLGEAVVRVEEARLENASVRAGLRLEALPLDHLDPLLPRPLEGVLDATLSLRGPLERPQVVADLDVRGLRALMLEEDDLPVMDIQARLRQGPKEPTRLDATLSGLDDEPLALEASLPVWLALTPPGLQRAADGALAARLRGGLDLEPLPSLLRREALLLEGALQLDIEATGTLDAPTLSGRARLEGARLEQPDAGLLARNMTALVDLRGERLTLASLSADDGEGGRFQAQGEAALALERNFPFFLRLTLDGARLLRTETVWAAASGNATFAGDTRGAALSGNLVTDGVDITIPETPPPAVASLEYQEVNAPNATQAAPSEKDDPYRVALDLRVDMPRRVFVRGRGVDVEFQGGMDVGGEAGAPLLEGRLNVVRGAVDFAGKTFKVTQGEILLNGASPPDPFLNIVAEGKADDVVAKIALRGLVSDFDISFSSQPPLPEEEVVSRILFGRSAASLNPMQAAVLANTYNELSGGGPGLVGGVRSMLGLDRLRTDVAEDGGIDVGVGKYLSEDVYLEFDQNLQSGEQGVSVEIELFPGLNLESGAGTGGGGSLGLKYKKDY